MGKDLPPAPTPTPRSARHPFRGGDVLGRGFGVWGRNVLRFVTLMIVVYSPFVAYTLILAFSDAPPDAWGLWELIHSWAAPLLGYLATAVLVLAVFQQLRGKTTTLGGCLRAGLRRLIPIIFVAICVFFCAAIWWVPVGLMVVVEPLLAFVFMLAAVFLSLYFTCTFWVAIPVTIVEKKGIFASMGRSRLLSRGHKWWIVLILLILFAMQIGVNMVIMMTTRFSLDALRNPDEIVGYRNMGIYAILIVGSNLFVGSLNATMTAVAYHDLRRSKEGVGVEDLVRVFE